MILSEYMCTVEPLTHLTTEVGSRGGGEGWKEGGTFRTICTPDFSCLIIHELPWDCIRCPECMYLFDVVLCETFHCVLRSSVLRSSSTLRDVLFQKKKELVR